MKNDIEFMSTQSNDLARYKEEQRQQWDSVAAGWKKWWRTIENGAQYVSKRMVELAEVEPGQRVLDVATGIGEPALLAASIVGPAGRVVATDLSSQMLDIVRERASTLGLTNVDSWKRMLSGRIFLTAALTPFSVAGACHLYRIR